MRHTLAGFATGLAVVAAVVDGRVVGMAANSLMSVSLDPPLISLSFARSSTTWPVLRRAPRWGISVLGEGDAGLLQALRRPAPERFEGVDLRTDAGAALLRGALATLVVSTHSTVEAGDHTVVLLHVEHLTRNAHRRPLVFFDSAVHTLTPAPEH